MAGQNNFIPSDTEEGLTQRLKQLCETPEKVEEASNFVFDYMIEDILMGLVFEEHMALRSKNRPVMTEEDSKETTIVENKNTDVLGTPFKLKQTYCFCPSCNQQIAASRLAPHLDKCTVNPRSTSKRRSVPGKLRDDDLPVPIKEIGGQKKSDNKSKVSHDLPGEALKFEDYDLPGPSKEVSSHKGTGKKSKMSNFLPDEAFEALLNDDYKTIQLDFEKTPTDDEKNQGPQVPEDFAKILWEVYGEKENDSTKSDVALLEEVPENIMRFRPFDWDQNEKNNADEKMVEELEGLHVVKSDSRDEVKKKDKE